MAFVKLTPLALFLLALFLAFPMKKIEANCSGICSPFEWPHPCGSADCRCIPWVIFGGQCIDPIGSKHVTKMAEEHPNLCQSHVDCLEKKSGSFCARYPNPDIPYGWCFDSNAEAERVFEIGSNSAIKDFFKTHSNSNNAKEYLKMPVETIGI